MTYCDIRCWRKFHFFSKFNCFVRDMNTRKDDKSLPLDLETLFGFLPRLFRLTSLITDFIPLPSSTLTGRRSTH